MFKPTTALNKILALKKRLRIIQGGSSAGKTIAILLILIDRAQNESGKLFSVVSESFPHLKRGAIRDFHNILEAQHFFKDSEWNQTDCIYTFANGSKIEFFSADQPGKVRGPRRDVLFVNEANNISYETYTQLSIRTNEDIYIDYNPVSEFWAHTEIIDKGLDHDFLILTYKDNEGLPATIVGEIEARRINKSWFRVYGEGLVGQLEGVIYRGWQILDDIPHEARLERRGLDYGYTNDPTAIVDVYYLNGGYIVDEVAFQKGLSNKQIADIILNQEKQCPVAPDSAEPKSNDELKAYGVTILEVPKGKDSVRQGIQFVQDQRISVTKRSVNIIKEYRNYLWLTDKDGNYVTPNEPDHAWSHSMDAIRYAFQTLKPRDTEVHKLQAERFVTNQYRQEYNSTR